MLFLDQQTRAIPVDQVVLVKHVAAGEAAFPKISTHCFIQVNQLVITRKPKMCNFIDYKEYKIVYKRYASLYFIAIVDKNDN